MEMRQWVLKPAAHPQHLLWAGRKHSCASGPETPNTRLRASLQGCQPPSRSCRKPPVWGEAEQQVLTGLANPQNCLGDTNVEGAEAARLWGVLEPSRAWGPIPGQVGKAFVSPSLLWV